MPTSIVAANRRTYVFSPDDQPPLGARLWALVRARVIDELTRSSPTSAITVEAEGKGFTPRVASDGLVGLTGVPRNVFPNLALQNYDVRLTVRAEGYLPRERTVRVAQTRTFPADFTPPLPVEIYLHREPTVITGRAVRIMNNATTPFPDVSITVEKIWRRPPAANETLPHESNLVSLQPPLYSDRTPGIGGLRRGSLLPPVAGDDKFLLKDVAKGSNSIQLPSRQGLRMMDILLIDTNSPDITEYLEIAGMGVAIQPARITLEFPLAHSHRKSALVQKVRIDPQSLGWEKQFAHDPLTGDTCVFLDDVTGLATGDLVRISNGPNLREYHRLSLFSAISDAEGYYRLPPLNRGAQLEILAEKPPSLPDPLSPIRVEFRPDHTLRENRLDFIFR